MITHLCLLLATGHDLRVDAVSFSARDQMNWGITYDPAYKSLRYPGGDVARNRGVCSDVIVRSYRAIGLDLQEQVHEDMKAAWGEYPRYSGVSKPDSNIDHRRVKNLAVYFRRHWKTLKATDPWLRGDVVTWVLPTNLDHIGVVVGFREGKPLIVHNLGEMREDCSLTDFKIVGHYRFLPSVD